MYIKNEQVCSHCKGILSYNEEAVVLRIKFSGGVSIKFFHTDNCYERWNSEVYLKRLLSWRVGATQRPVRRRIKGRVGRPVEYRDTLQAQRLYHLLYYYRRVGNKEREAELKSKIEGLRIRPVGGNND